MGLGVTPTQIIGSCSSSMRSGSPSDAATIEQLQSEIEMLKARVGGQLGITMRFETIFQSSHGPQDNGGSSKRTI
ncbi:hypothetical protein SESBI_39261 [Sesbania bispinosa]|nr:hypothetical protein SESBI_39261 [Sesbania bispinosa]